MKFRLGVVAMAASFLPYLALGVVPFLGISPVETAGVIAAALIGAEIVFWSGLLLAGAQARAAIRAHGWSGAPRIMWRMLRSGRAVGIAQASETRSA